MKNAAAFRDVTQKSNQNQGFSQRKIYFFVFIKHRSMSKNMFLHARRGRSRTPKYL
jgi:hypothetical protein